MQQRQKQDRQRKQHRHRQHQQQPQQQQAGLTKPQAKPAMRQWWGARAARKQEGCQSEELKEPGAEGSN